LLDNNDLLIPNRSLNALFGQLTKRKYFTKWARLFWHVKKHEKSATRASLAWNDKEWPRKHWYLVGRPNTV